MYCHCFTEPFSGGDAGWKTANTILAKSMDRIDNILNTLNVFKDVCLGFISASPGTSTPCTSFTIGSRNFWYIILEVLRISLQVSEEKYDEIVVGQNDDFEAQRQEVTLANVEIIHSNIISNFNLAQQLKLLLGGVLEAMPSNEDDETQRRLSVLDCEDAINDVCKNKTKVSCEDPKFLCGGFSINWHYVAYLKFGEISKINAIYFLNCPSMFLMTHHELSSCY